jgi:hypothetical protein
VYQIALINVTTAGTINNTKIGTARVKSIAFESAANTSNSQTYVYRTYLFDVNIGSITGNVNSASSNTTHLGLSLSGSLYSNVDNAYQGAKIRITSGLGSTDSPKTIVNYNAGTKIIELSSPYTLTPNNQSLWSIDFEFNDVDSLVTFDSGVKKSAADIDIASRDYASTYGDSYVADVNLSHYCLIWVKIILHRIQLPIFHTHISVCMNLSHFHLQNLQH